MSIDPLDLVADAQPVEEKPTNGTAPAPASALTTSNPLGLSLDVGNPSEKMSFIVIYGEPKIGKSVETAKVLSHCLWLCAEPSVLAFYASWYGNHEKEARAKGMRDPRLPWEQGGMARKTIPEFLADGVTPYPTYDTLNVILTRYLTSVQNGTCPYDGLVLDEYNVFADRVWNDMLRICVNPNDRRFKTKVGKAPDKYAPPREVINWANWLCSIARVANGTKKLALVCHPVDPNLEDGVKGGPKGPTAKSRKAILKSADAIVRFYKTKVRANENDIDDLGLSDDNEEKKVVELPDEFPGEVIDSDGYAVRIQTQSDDLWEAGIRADGIPSRVKSDLRGLLVDSGFKFA